MKILYITDQDLNNNSGVSNKVRSQVKYWANQGHDVEIINFHTLSLYPSLNTAASKTLGNPHKSTGKFGLFLRIWLHSFKIGQYLKSSKPDLVYSRYILWSPFITLWGRHAAIVMEINSDEREELKNRSLPAYFYNKLTRKLTFLSLNGIVFVSRELKAKNMPLHIPSLIVANSINDSFFEYEQGEKFGHDKIHIAFSISNDQNWQGLDKAIKFVEHENEFHLHVIGLSSENSANITYHGKLSSVDAAKITSKCDIAFSTLALHRKNMEEASPLKSREALALGLPIVSAYLDTDLADSKLDFILNLPNTDTNVEESRTKLREFVRNSRNTNKQEIRNRTKELIGLSSKEEHRLNFFAKLLGFR